MLCSSIAAAFKSFKLSLFEWFKWEKLTCLAWRRISSENSFQSAFFKLKNWEQIEFSTSSAALVLILNLMISWSEPEALNSLIYQSDISFESFYVVKAKFIIKLLVELSFFYRK